MHGTLTRKFVDLMGDYQEIQTKYAGVHRNRKTPTNWCRGLTYIDRYKNKYRERVERQVGTSPREEQLRMRNL